jgi:hypothetical protein
MASSECVDGRQQVLTADLHLDRRNTIIHTRLTEASYIVSRRRFQSLIALPSRAVAELNLRLRRAGCGRPGYDKPGTREQADKAASLARQLGNGIVTVFLDCDQEGENGMKQCLGYLAQLCPVRLAWTSKMYGGKYKGKQPESLMIQEWQEIEGYLKTGKAEGWSLA